METSEIKEIWESLPSEKKTEIIRIFCNSIKSGDYSYEPSISIFKKELEFDSTIPDRLNNLYLEIDIIDPMLSNLYMCWVNMSFHKKYNNSVDIPLGRSIIKQFKKDIIKCDDNIEKNIKSFLDYVITNDCEPCFLNKKYNLISASHLLTKYL